MLDIMENIRQAIEREIHIEVCRISKQVLKERNAFENALADEYVKQGRTFVKGPYRMQHPDEAIPSPDALERASVRAEGQNITRRR
jgi:hypothetical protein